ncbi:hypothetical protein N7454_001869 [Penicillium verhagenii]|nr:hypothetical protein N7454_001869 [Penicillium verhagenii]
MWASTTTYKPTANKGKQADQAFIPPRRLPVPGQRHGWPTLVIETGVSESLPRLREDARWWLENSGGEVKLHQADKVEFELWRLAPPNSPRPLTRAFIDDLRRRNVNAFAPQAVGMQQMYCHHEADVFLGSITGSPIVKNAPMMLPFEGLYDRPPGPLEGDLMLTDKDFVKIVHTVLWPLLCFFDAPYPYSLVSLALFYPVASFLTLAFASTCCLHYQLAIKGRVSTILQAENSKCQVLSSNGMP